jgi:5-dehydro-4-deoxyglucarate dehydratase
MSPSTARVTEPLSGVLAFPVTPFRESGDVDPSRFRTHLTGLLAAKPGAIDRGLAALNATPVA